MKWSAQMIWPWKPLMCFLIASTSSIRAIRCSIGSADDNTMRAPISPR